MTIEILGAGFGRTGTYSLKCALEILGKGPCYHMYEVGKHKEHVSLWSDAIEHNYCDWEALFRGYKAAVDWPTVSFLPQLLVQYPKAKVILTTRDPNEWYESARNTIFNAMEMSYRNPDLESRKRTEMSKRLILDKLFSGRYKDKDYCISVYTQHIQSIEKLIPNEKLLMFSVAEGWAPLCWFLQVPIPAVSFPYANDRESFLSMKPEWAK